MGKESFSFVGVSKWGGESGDSSEEELCSSRVEVVIVEFGRASLRSTESERAMG